MRPEYPAWRRNFNGRPAVLVGSFDCPITTTERGENKTSRSLSSPPPEKKGESASAGLPLPSSIAPSPSHAGLPLAVRPSPFRGGRANATPLSRRRGGSDSLRRIGLPSTLIEAAIENLLCDASLEDFH